MIVGKRVLSPSQAYSNLVRFYWHFLLAHESPFKTLYTYCMGMNFFSNIFLIM